MITPGRSSTIVHENPEISPQKKIRLQDPDAWTHAAIPRTMPRLPQAFLAVLRLIIKILLACARVVALPHTIPWAVGSRLAEVDAKFPSVDFLSLEDLLSLGGTGDVDEVGVGEASGLAGSPVNGNTHVHDVANVAEEVVQVLVGHLEGHVADEESLGRRVVRCGTVEPSTVATVAASAVTGGFGAVELDNEVPAFEDLHVQVVNGSLSIVDALELNVTETVG
jgi:hypothetical protein